MKKISKGEVVLSACEVQATRLNKLEHRRLQRHVTLLQDDLDNQLARLHRQEQGLRYHYTNVVRFIKPNPAYQRWKAAHAQEIAQDEAEELISALPNSFFETARFFPLESIKRKHRSVATRRQSSAPIARREERTTSMSLRPLLLLVDDGSEKSSPEFDWNMSESFLRPNTSPERKPAGTNKRRVNPLMTMLGGNPVNSSPSMQLVSSTFDSPSFRSSSSRLTNGSRKLVQGKFVQEHKAEDLDAMYRIALQNRTACKTIDQKRLNRQKLLDKDFATQYRALHGSIRSAGVVR